MSSASRCASSVVMKSLSPSTPKPRLTSPQQAVESRGRQLAPVAPDLAAGARVERPGDVLRSRDIEDVVAQERGRFEIAERGGLERPLRHQAVDVVGRDLRERAVAVVGVVAAEGQPAARRRLQAGENLLRRHRAPAAPAARRARPRRASRPATTITARDRDAIASCACQLSLLLNRGIESAQASAGSE